MKQALSEMLQSARADHDDPPNARLGVRLAGGQRYIGRVVDGAYTIGIVRDRLPPIYVDADAVVAVDAWPEPGQALAPLDPEDE